MLARLWQHSRGPHLLAVVSPYGAAPAGDWRRVLAFGRHPLDGVLTGINWDSTIALANAVSIPVIASGGLASIDDIVRMTKPDAAKLEGAISGRALYDGRIDPAEALSILRGNPPGGRGA